MYFPSLLHSQLYFRFRDVSIAFLAFGWTDPKKLRTLMDELARVHTSEVL